MLPRKERTTAVDSRRSFLNRLSLLTATWPMGQYLRASSAQSHPELVALPSSTQRPAWCRQGMVAAAFDEPLEFYIRRGDSPTDIVRWWRETFSEATIKQYADIGINLVFITLQKGMGLQTEADSTEV